MHYQSANKQKMMFSDCTKIMHFFENQSYYLIQAVFLYDKSISVFWIKFGWRFPRREALFWSRIFNICVLLLCQQDSMITFYFIYLFVPNFLKISRNKRFFMYSGRGHLKTLSFGLFKGKIHLYPKVLNKIGLVSRKLMITSWVGSEPKVILITILQFAQCSKHPPFRDYLQTKLWW